MKKFNAPKVLKAQGSKEDLQLDFLSLSEQLGFQTPEDWYKLERKHLPHNRSFNIPLLLHQAFSNHYWNPLMFERKLRTPKFWMDWIGIQLGLKDMEGWYEITKKDIQQKGKGFPYFNFRRSFLRSKTLYQWLAFVYPRHAWQKWRFGDWNLEKRERKQLVEWLAKELKVDSTQEWYRISWFQIYDKISPKFLEKYPLEMLLKEAYPRERFDVARFQTKHLGTIQASQRILTKLVKEIFPESVIFENFYHEELLRISGRPIQLDIYLPNEHLALEYQGEQHYYDIYAVGSLWLQKEKDEEKRRACKQKGITLIEIPYWWDFQKSNLMGTIHKYAPHLIPQAEESIPDSPLHGFPKGPVSELMHPESWDGNEDLCGWWISEKMDGVRAYWNGEKLISRNAMDISCPTWFVDGLPKGVKLDGELWMGKGLFEKTVASLNLIDKTPWKNMKFVIFDSVVANIPYEVRMEELKLLNLPSFASVIEIRACRGNEDLIRELNDIVSKTGEGIVVTKPQSMYEPLRTRNRLKVKLYDDSEVLLLEVLPTGFYCLQTNGIECIVGCANRNMLEHPPKIGSVITVKHNGSFNGGTLRYAFFWRERPNFEWNAISNEKRALFPDAYWTIKENSMKFFESLKIRLKFKSLDDFHRITIEDITNHGGKALIMRLFSGSVLAALHSVYGDHKWSPWRLRGNVPRGFWESKENQRNFIECLQRELGYKTMQDWYKLKTEHFKFFGGISLLGKYKGSPLAVVQAVFPEHEWNRVSKTDKPPDSTDFMDWLAKKLGYDNMDDWYRITVDDIKKYGGFSFLQEHGGSTSKFLASIYPQHKWHSFHFKTLPKRYWEEIGNQKEYLEWLRKDLGLNDLTQIRAKDLERVPGNHLLKKYNGSVVEMLRFVFPERKWHLFKFGSLPKGYWEKMENQKEFLEYLASYLKLKKLDDWYNVTMDDIKRAGGYSLLQNYNCSRFQLFQGVYPDHKWRRFKFGNLPKTHWEKMENQREFMEWLFENLSFKQMNDWYMLKINDIKRNGGQGLLLNYDGSILQLFQTVYPNHSWAARKFQTGQF